VVCVLRPAGAAWRFRGGRALVRDLVRDVCADRTIPDPPHPAQSHPRSRSGLGPCPRGTGERWRSRRAICRHGAGGAPINPWTSRRGADR
jgi:hypothetical protein